ncbi:MAG: argininosuccinate lyase [Planctomycetes bacterium]|nr:argininosuccinate lyase [Planctomycetota bacterium]
MKNKKKRLWEKGTEPDELIHRFTVGDDPEWDRHLVHWDCLGSAAHARTLERAGILTADERGRLLAGLAQVDALDRAGEFAIPPELEDCHTAIESFLTRACGDAGAKIHTGRSRNDQVVCAMRLFMRHHALAWLDELARFVRALLDRMQRDGEVPMPGYTHMQPAMPSSVGQWLHAWVEAALEQTRAAFDLLDRLDACPLGTGAGFGVPLPLDREYTAELLGFARVQRSPIDVQNSRGRTEIYFVRVGVDVGALLEKLSWDLILFAGPQYGFFGLPEEMTTGSSIMPQKKNPDVLELMRARAGRLRARLHELEWVAGKLPSSYHRDLQLTKEPAIRTALEVSEMLQVATRVVSGFTVNRETLAAAMQPELYATHAAVALTEQGVPFREAYRRVADDLRAGRFREGSATAADKHTGRVAADVIDDIRSEVERWSERARVIGARHAAVDTILESRPREAGNA